MGIKRATRETSNERPANKPAQGYKTGRERPASRPAVEKAEILDRAGFGGGGGAYRYNMELQAARAAPGQLLMPRRRIMEAMQHPYAGQPMRINRPARREQGPAGYGPGHSKRAQGLDTGDEAGRGEGGQGVLGGQGVQRLGGTAIVE